MAPRSLLQLLTLTAAAAVFTETAQAAVYQAPDLSNPLENRIQALRDGAWQPQLNAAPGGQLIARYWGNGGGHNWGNGGRGGGWRNGGGGWGNGGRYYGGGVNVNLGWPNGGWGNGGWGNVLPSSFINW
ncbi:rSAM-associated Gly-rich repeat protein [Synechococcus sp. HK05]|uniref:GrrA/OscA1 family cyclophane-containing rSAM-modified RiPP n=1 Tax=Synechococcus sp. HK05 TaxID=2725975 RepID=UPI001C395193|nr:GrrA/OscA1 family cyclophane-containing rSAM-modified RiPP [Synechococcus sp. HK05]MBV2350255.1 rSAM-associated Gly-rich repeat protein [Synechococcus sp. HK05]